MIRIEQWVNFQEQKTIIRYEDINGHVIRDDRTPRYFEHVIVVRGCSLYSELRHSICSFDPRRTSLSLSFYHTRTIALETGSPSNSECHRNKYTAEWHRICRGSLSTQWVRRLQRFRSPSPTTKKAEKKTRRRRWVLYPVRNYILVNSFRFWSYFCFVLTAVHRWLRMKKSHNYHHHHGHQKQSVSESNRRKPQ